MKNYILLGKPSEILNITSATLKVISFMYKKFHSITCLGVTKGDSSAVLFFFNLGTK
jgi:hypothetical protein